MTLQRFLPRVAVRIQAGVYHIQTTDLASYNLVRTRELACYTRVLLRHGIGSHRLASARAS
jgi:hypothetical protein